jgi:hypothetical protein
VAPLAAAKFATECNIAVRNHVPVYKHWKDYKDQASLFNLFTDKLSVSALSWSSLPVNSDFPTLCLLAFIVCLHDSELYVHVYPCFNNVSWFWILPTCLPLLLCRQSLISTQIMNQSKRLVPKWWKLQFGNNDTNLRKKYFDPFPLHLVTKMSPIRSMTDKQWNDLVEYWKSLKKWYVSS